MREKATHFTMGQAIAQHAATSQVVIARFVFGRAFHEDSRQENGV
jgi:hypothetical protein